MLAKKRKGAAYNLAPRVIVGDLREQARSYRVIVSVDGQFDAVEQLFQLLLVVALNRLCHHFAGQVRANFSMKSHMKPRRKVPRRKPILVTLDSNNSLASSTTKSLSRLVSTAILATIPTPRPRRT